MKFLVCFLEISILKEYYVMSKVKTTGFILAMVMVFGAVDYFSKEINAQGTTYKVGDRGPAGGWIFYDKGNNAGGWRYLEAAPVDQSPAAKGGCGKVSTPDAKGIVIGTGKANTAAIIKSCTDAGIAAKIAADYRGGDKSDWFLPSRDELNLMYVTLRKAGVGGLAKENYWSSSEVDAYKMWLQSFRSGAYNGNYKSMKLRVRAVRAF